MKLRTLATLAAFALSSCATVQAPSAPSNLQLVDLTDDFDRQWSRTEGSSDAARVAAFKTYFGNVLPGFYDHKRMGLPGPEKYDARFLEGLKKYPQERAGIKEVSRRFSAMIEPARRSFEAQFGPMTGYPPVYLVNALGEFDGGTRSLPEGTRLLFGADVIARLHLQHNIQPFVHHELFHLYHNRNFTECRGIWCGLWKEGLATYVAARLNPGATDAELLLTSPEPLRPVVERNRALAVCTTLSKLESTSSDDYKALFSNGSLDNGLPSRFGYYVGYLAAEEAGKTKSLQELAKLPKEEVRPLIEASLRNLAFCPA